MEDLMEQPAETLDSDAASTNAAEDSNDAAGRSDDDQLGNSQEQSAEEESEIEVGDKKITLPKSIAEKLKAERMMRGDYTQKTQAVADERKQVAAEREQLRQQEKSQSEYIKEMAKVVSIDEQLAQYNALNWNQIISTDPLQAMQLQQQQKALETERMKATESLTQKQQQIALDKQQSFAKQIQDADAYMKREIPGFSPVRSDELAKYAASQGMTADQAAKAIIKNPLVAKLLHKADLYDKLISKQAPKPAPVVAAKPALKVGANASVKKDPTQMTDKEFAEYRRRTSSQRK